MEASQRPVKRFAGAVERSTSHSSAQDCNDEGNGQRRLQSEAHAVASSLRQNWAPAKL